MIRNVFKQRRIHCASFAMFIIGCAPDDTPQPIPVPQPIPAPQLAAAPQNAPAPVATNRLPLTANRSIWEGVFTEEQSRRGQVVYTSACVRCHGEDLEGDDVVPQLVGEEFLKRWSRKRAGNLFAYMKKEMPPKLKDRLTPPAYADVLAYLLRMNQAPAGEIDLPADFASLQSIRIDGSE